MDLTLQRNLSESYLPEVYTWRDWIVDLADTTGVRDSGLSDRRLRTATLDAYRDLCNKRDWNFLIYPIKLRTTARVSAAGYYDHTGGSSERLVTLTTGTVASAAALRDLSIVIDGLPYEPDTWLTTTTFTLSLRANPGQDVSSLASPGDIELVRIAYPCPANFVKAYTPEVSDNMGPIGWIAPESVHAWSMRQTPQYGEPRGVAVMQHPKLIGSKCLMVIPYPTESRLISLLYHGTARALNYHGLSSGQVGTFTTDIGVDANKCTIVSGITVSSKMIGSIFRLRSDTQIPENRDGQYPFEEQATIIAVSGTTIVYLDRDLTSSYTAKACVISDPVDVPQVALTALKAGARYYHALAANKDRKDIQLLEGFYQKELIQLCENDNGIISGTRGGTEEYFQDDSEVSEDWIV